ncbi:MAG: GIY-YIG nuclease family protein, partial [Candidatus Pacebacteria bacterium]|nr:GIY-YIG nuclease family protein [Candidatus Paceibacterota bacterium]
MLRPPVGPSFPLGQYRSSLLLRVVLLRGTTLGGDSAADACDFRTSVRPFRWSDADATFSPMNRQDLEKLNLPDAPGVYFFKRGRTVLYVGKATSLKSRVRSYFLPNAVESRGLKIPKMLVEATTVAYEQTDSVLEALIRESYLIKKYQPPYNAKEKSDTSFNYVVITDEAFPRLFTMRERDLRTTGERIKYTFGPFPHGGQLKDALKIIRKIFPYRGKTDAPLPHAKRRGSTLYEEMGLVPKGAGSLDPKEYGKTIRHLVLFFEGKKKELVRSLEKTMRAYAKERTFEAASEIKRQLFALQHINDVSLMKNSGLTDPTKMFRIEAYDTAHTMGTDVVGVMTVVEGDAVAKNDYRMFTIKQATSGRFINDTAALEELLTRRFGHPEWPYPKLIVVDGST